MWRGPEKASCRCRLPIVRFCKKKRQMQNLKWLECNIGGTNIAKGTTDPRH